MCDRRESTQLWLLASHYLRLAKNALDRVEDKSITVGQVAERSKKYNPDGSIDAENETLGHLASAAIRLATIAENHKGLNLGKNY